MRKSILLKIPRVMRHLLNSMTVIGSLFVNLNIER